jgi:mono/diheme cytochrome c family protein
MKLGTLTVAAFVITLLTVACTNTNTTTPTNSAPAPPVAAATSTPDQFAATRGNYSKHCAACHQDNGSGGTVKVEEKRLKVPTLREGHALKDKDEEFVKQISAGGDGMPPFKDKLKPEEITDLVKFIRKEFQGK